MPTCDELAGRFRRYLPTQSKTIQQCTIAVCAALITSVSFSQPIVSTPPTKEQLQDAVAVAEPTPSDDNAPLLKALEDLAVLHQKANRPRDLLPVLQRMAEIQERTLGPNHPDVAHAWNHVAATHRELGNLREALALNERSLAIYRAAHPADHTHVATGLNELGFTRRALGEYPAARRYYEESIAMKERLPAHPQEDIALTMHNLGAVLRLMGQSEEALRYLTRAGEIEERVNGPDHPNMAVRHNVTASAYEDLGEYGKALPLYERALAISEKALGSEHSVIATRLNNLAGTLLDLGRPEEALTMYKRAAAIDEKVLGPVHARLAMRLNGAAVALRELKRLDEAQNYAERALAVGEKALGPSHIDVAVWTNNLAQVHRAKGEYEQALVLFDRGISIYEGAVGANDVRIAGALNGKAAAQWESGDRDGAAASLQRAIGILAATPRPDTLWRVQAALRRAHEGLGNGDLSIYWGKQAVNTIQGFRSRMASLSPSLQQSFLRDKRAVYVALADQLIAAGRLAEAQEVLSMLKEEELYDFIARSSAEDARTTRATFVGPEEAVAQARWQEISAQLAQLGRESSELTRKARVGLTPEEQERRKQVDADLVLANQRFDGFLTNLSREFAAAGARRAEELGSRQLRNLVVMQDVLAELGRNTVLLHYVVAENRVAIIVTTADVQIARESHVSAADLNRKVLAFRQALSARSDVTAAARELHDLLIKPVADDLKQAGARALMFSLDGTLRYLPFAALHDGRRYLVESYTLSIYTEAARTQITRKPQPEWTMTGLGMTRAAPGFAPLPAVRQELEGIRRNALRGDVYLDDQFTAERLRDALGGTRQVMHIASHFQFKPGTFANSFLVLGDGGRLTLQEIRDRRLRFSNIELLTLSACDTAMGGGIDETGAEVEGFGALAQQQGASAVLATLWPVADGSTGRFMQLVYGRRHNNPKLTKAEALRQAQLTFLRSTQSAVPAAVRSGLTRPAAVGTDPPFTTDPTRPHAHPYYWAAFILMGNWL